jgi:GT2 family glycosyltransferase
MADFSQVSIIIVSWNVRELLRACLASLPCDAETIVVDNASVDGSAEMVARDFPHVRLVTNSENRGFTGGNNDGLKLSTRPFVFFLNPDTVVQGDALERMLAYLDAHPGVGVVGPQLRYGDGLLQSSRRRFPTLGTALFESTPLAWHWPAARNGWARRYHLDDRPADQEQDVDWLVGAALMTRREVLDRVGGFDEGYFMYSEELDWQRRVQQAGWKIVYLPVAVITHYEGKSSEQATAARHIRFNRSKVRYFRKHHGRLRAEFLRLALLVMFGFEWTLEAAKYLLGSQRSMRRTRLSAYSQLVRSGLSK